MAGAISTGIKTRIHEDDPYGYSVEWMNWDSEFRKTSLRHGDIITGVNDKLYSRATRDADHARSVGNYLESTFFAETGCTTLQPVILHIDRDGEKLEISGLLSEPQHYFNSDGKTVIGENGPVRLTNDGFSSSWANWYEKFENHLSLYLDDPRWERNSLDNRRRLAEHWEWKPRVDFLASNYPGRFTDTVVADWELAKTTLEGKIYTDITEATLEYRAIGARRVELVKIAANEAKRKFLETDAAGYIDAFPAVDAVHGDILSVTGKRVVLPVITFDHFINDLGKTFAVIGSKENGYYFIHLNSPEMDIFFRSLFHYKAQVTPDIPEKFEFIVEIENHPAMLSVDRKPVSGVMVKTLAGVAGDGHVFVDVQKNAMAGSVSFSGEEQLVIFDQPSPLDSATAEEIIESMIHYVKMGDMKAWKKLFANWQIYIDGDGPPFMDFKYGWLDESFQDVWEKSRKQVLNVVYDARVIYSNPIKTVVQANRDIGLPHVEQVKVIVDHIGKFDGQYSSISNLYVHRRWILQRLEGGPWKIRELQGL